MVIALLGNWIEGKISRTIEDKISMVVQKNLVFPNLDDVVCLFVLCNPLVLANCFNSAHKHNYKHINIKIYMAVL